MTEPVTEPVTGTAAGTTSRLLQPTDLDLRPVDPDRDAALLHAWVSEERAEFWGMRGKPLEEVRDIYRYIDEQEHLAAYLVVPVGVADADAEPLALFQTYDPFVDEVGDHYDRRPGDVGAHLFIGPGPRPAGSGDAIGAFIVGWLAGHPGHRRVVLEPDVRNERSIAFALRAGAELGPVVELPHKTAQLAFLHLRRSGPGTGSERDTV